MVVCLKTTHSKLFEQIAWIAPLNHLCYLFRVIASGSAIILIISAERMHLFCIFQADSYGFVDVKILGIFCFRTLIEFHLTDDLILVIKLSSNLFHFLTIDSNQLDALWTNTLNSNWLLTHFSIGQIDVWLIIRWILKFVAKFCDSKKTRLKSADRNQS